MNFPSAAPSAVSGNPWIAESLDLAISKTRRNLPALAAEPASWAFDRDGNYENMDEGFFDIGNWTTSFFTGMAAIAYLQTGDDDFIDGMEPLDPYYRAKLGERVAETMHDLGFLYSLYSVALHKVTGEARHREVGLRAAEVLASRYVPEGRYIRAWGRMDEPDTDYAGLAIIDCLMNMPLLYWASEETGETRFREIALKHTDTTLKHFVREDDSVFHAFRFHAETGEPSGGDNYCGRAVDSHWARGTTWAMYGFALAYRHTSDIRYLDAALRLTRKFISLLDDELVPVWDFRLKPGESPLRDSSAAAVAACAIQELEALDQATPEFTSVKMRLLEKLCSPKYLDTLPGRHGILKHGQVGDGVGKAQKVYTSWGDYYFMEALARETGLEVNWW
jgi:unsaturated chondroitin disaccharide hydrolase